MKNKLKVICISDTHNHCDLLELPYGDILVHAGDISAKGTIEEIEAFNRWIASIKHKYRYIICIAGNHDFLFEQDNSLARSIISNAIYLQDEMIVIEGRKIYGTPWQPSFLKWAFNLDRGSQELKEKWANIPSDLDLLLSHSPPKGFCDTLKREKTYDDEQGIPILGTIIEHMGCEDLYQEVMLKKPKNHVFGHIHDGYGSFQTQDTLFVNASICTEEYDAINKPIIIYI